MFVDIKSIPNSENLKENCEQIIKLSTLPSITFSDNK